jgi:hypothetical protein
MRIKNTLFLIACMIITAGCFKQSLPEPVVIIQPKMKPIEDQEYLKYLSIDSDTNNLQKECILIQKAFVFLKSVLGNPIYQNKIIVKITKKHISYPKMVYNNKKRIVSFSSFYMDESEMPTIVHELFHALYQNDQIIETHTDFILEGMAIYIENLYKYKDDEQVKQKLNFKLINEQICTRFNNSFLFDKRFYSFNSSTKYDLYILAGNFYAMQELDTIEFIKRILNNKSITYAKALDGFVNHYQLTKFPCNIEKYQDMNVTNATVSGDNGTETNKRSER